MTRKRTGTKGRRHPRSSGSPPPPSPSPRRKPSGHLLPKLALSVVVFVLAVLMVELVLQVAFRLQHGMWLYEETKAFEIHYTKPVHGVRGYALRPEYDDGTVAVNHDGFRSDPIPHGADIVCVIGDSVPFGAGVGNRETYPFYLQRYLADHGNPLPVLNAGVPSYNLRQSFDRLRGDVMPRWTPRVVVAQAANDLSLVTHYRDQWTADLTWAAVRWSEKWRCRLSNLSCIGRLLASAHPERKPPKEEHHPYSHAAMLDYVQGMLRKECSALVSQGIPVVLLSVNAFFYSNDEAKTRQLPLWRSAYYRHYRTVREPGMIQLNQLLARIAADIDGVYYLDVRSAMDRMNRATLFHDYCHHTPDGNRAVAALVGDFLVQHGLVGDASPAP